MQVKGKGKVRVQVKEKGKGKVRVQVKGKGKVEMEAEARAKGVHRAPWERVGAGASPRSNEIRTKVSYNQIYIVCEVE